MPLPRWVEVTGLGCLDKQTAIHGVEFMTLAILPYEQTIAAGRLSWGCLFLAMFFVVFYGTCTSRRQKVVNSITSWVEQRALVPTRKDPWKVPVSFYIQLLWVIPDTPRPTRKVLCTLRQRKIQSLGSFVRRWFSMRMQIFKSLCSLINLLSLTSTARRIEIRTGWPDYLRSCLFERKYVLKL